VKKLGIKPGSHLYVFQAPPDYFAWLDPMPEDLEIKQKPVQQLDFIHLFVKGKKEFEKAFAANKKFLRKDGMLWVSWPKKSSKIETDLDENVIRDFGLKEGLVDVKVCAVDETWSGLKFVIRVKDR
jgi:hypothetical protein